METIVTLIMLSTAALGTNKARALEATDFTSMAKCLAAGEFSKKKFVIDEYVCVTK